MRVLFTTTPGRGHFTPMLGLARALRERGHEVSWATHASACGPLREAGFQADEAGLPEGLTSRGLAAEFPELMTLPPAERPEFLFAKIFGPRRAGPMLDDLLPIVRARRPSLLVCDQGELAGPLAAALAGVPNVTHGFGHPLPAPRVRRAADELAALWEAHGLEPRPFAGAYDHLYLDIYPQSLQTYESPHIEAVLPTRPASRSVGAASSWGEGDEPLVYVTFGTVFNRELDLIGAVLEGVARLPVRVVLTCGPGRDVGALGEQPANVRVAQFIPQEELLGACSLVVSHAGSGTFLASLAHGLPQLLLPQAADQFLNAAAGAGAGAGIAIQPESVTADAVAEAAAELLADGAYRDAAQRLGAEIAAMPGPDAVAAEVEARFG